MTSFQRRGDARRTGRIGVVGRGGGGGSGASGSCSGSAGRGAASPLDRPIVAWIVYGGAFGNFPLSSKIRNRSGRCCSIERSIKSMSSVPSGSSCPRLGVTTWALPMIDVPSRDGYSPPSRSRGSSLSWGGRGCGFGVRCENGIPSSFRFLGRFTLSSLPKVYPIFMRISRGFEIEISSSEIFVDARSDLRENARIVCTEGEEDMCRDSLPPRRRLARVQTLSSRGRTAIPDDITNIKP
mgnify:CR=1 FL=1